jgi:hypothetical protein
MVTLGCRVPRVHVEGQLPFRCVGWSVGWSVGWLVGWLIWVGPGGVVCVDTICPSESSSVRLGWYGWLVGWLVWVGLGWVVCFDTICQYQSSRVRLG